VACVICMRCNKKHQPEGTAVVKGQPKVPVWQTCLNVIYLTKLPAAWIIHVNGKINDWNVRRWVSKHSKWLFFILLCCLHCSLWVQPEAWTLCVIVKQFRPWTVSCDVELSTWRLPLRTHQKRTECRDSNFVGWRCSRRRNQSKTFSTIWKQCFAA
jgi:hypothetical protein